MASVPKPLIGLLVASVAFFALWTVALKPSSSGGSSGSSSPTVYKAAIDKAHQASTVSNRASAADGAPVSSTATATAPARAASAPSAASVTHAAKLGSAAKAAKAGSAGKPVSPAKPHGKSVSVNAVLKAISSHQPVAILFFNPAAADDQAVDHELSAVAASHRQVAKFAVPVDQLSAFHAITASVQVNVTPTLIIIDKHGRAGSLVGFADSLEISQRISDALSVK